MTIALDRAPGEVRAAALDTAGRLLDLAIERPGGTPDVGDLCRARVTARAPALAGAFVALADGEAFLPDSAGGRGVSEGSMIAVRVVRAPQGGKGARVAAVAQPPGEGAPCRLQRGPGAAERLASLYPGASLIEGWTETTAAAVAALAQPAVALPGGGSITVTPTAALVAIDVDLGRGAALKGGKGRTHMTANLGWVGEIARQIRLRNLGGAILIDFAGLSARGRGALGPALARALEDDAQAPRFLGFTGLGLAEIMRPRAHPPLHEQLAGAHASALAAARALARERQATPARRLRVQAAPAVAEAFVRDAVLQGDLRDRLGEPPRLRLNPALPHGSWELEEA